MKIVFFGDSITDMGRDYKVDYHPTGYGAGYVNNIASELMFEKPGKYDIINRGISGNRVIDLYARIKSDLWNLNPDVISILIGVNDVWHEIFCKNGVDIVRFEKIYRMIIEDTLKVLPNIKFILVEPFVLLGCETKDNIDEFNEVRNYAKVVEALAKEYNLSFVPLQDKFDDLANKYGGRSYLVDGVHPDVAGAKLITNEWLKVFKREIDTN